MRSFWKGQFLTLILVAMDWLAFGLIWLQAWELRKALDPPDGPFSDLINPKSNYVAILPILILVWTAVMIYFQHYSHRGKISSLNQIGNIFKAGFGLLVSTMAMAYLFKKPYDIGRSVILFSSVGMTFYVYLSRSTLRWLKEYFVARGHGLTRVAIIGAGQTGGRVADRIVNHPEIGYDLVGFIDCNPDLVGQRVHDAPVIGDTSELIDLLLRYRVEEVFLAVPSLDVNAKLNLVTECEQARVHFKIVTADLMQVITEKVKIDDIGDLPVIELPSGRLTPLGSLLKRLLDLSIAAPLLLVSALPMAFIALLIKLDSQGSAFFIQDRIGKDARRFRMLKFRTMDRNTDPYATAPNNAVDPRITRFGRFLRKSSLDELPQIWNVIKGEMSLVGPRPEMPFIAEQYEPWQRRRLDVPQGITGLWQIAGRKQLPLHQNLEYDFYYIRNWSLLLDLIILFKTIPSVLLGKGAF